MILYDKIHIFNSDICVVIFRTMAIFHSCIFLVPPPEAAALHTMPVMGVVELIVST